MKAEKSGGKVETKSMRFEEAVLRSVFISYRQACPGEWGEEGAVSEGRKQVKNKWTEKKSVIACG